jgi:hypothetical protein
MVSNGSRFDQGVGQFNRLIKTQCLGFRTGFGFRSREVVVYGKPEIGKREWFETHE